MVEMSMNKAIHAAVRRDLDRFVAALSTFPTGDRARAEQLHRAWVNFDDQLTHHHTGEHDIAWPALEAVGVSSDLLTTLDAEHDAMAEALKQAGATIDALVSNPGAEEAAAALAAFGSLKTVTVQHLDHEETETEALYVANAQTPEIKAMGRAFGKVSPARGGRFFAWVLDDASPDEHAAVRRDVPGPVLSVIGGIFGRDYRKNIATIWN
jgi:hypothetical protein